MAEKFYLDVEGAKTLVKYINDSLSVKLEDSDLADYATKADLANMEIEVDLSDYATKTEVINRINAIELPEAYDDTALTARVSSLEGKATGLYHFKGSVPTLMALQEIVNPEVGDTYNLEDTGMNAAWTGEAWDEFGSVADLTDYAKKEDIQAITLAELNTLLFSGKTAVVSTPESLKAVFENTQSEVEVTLNGDLTLTEAVVVPEGKTVTVNLDGNNINSGAAQALVASGIDSKLILEGEGTITSSANCTVQAQNGAEVVVDGVSIVSTGNNCVGSRGEGSKVTINSGSITGQEYGVIVTHGGNVDVNGGTLKGVDNFALGGNGSPGNEAGTVNINGGRLEGHITSPNYMATAIYWPNEGTLNVNGGTIVTDGAGIVQRGGTVNIGANAIIMPSNSPVDLEVGKAGDSRVVVGRYAVVFDKYSNYPAYENMALNIADGAQLSGFDGDVQVLPADATGIVDNRIPKVGE